SERHNLQQLMEKFGSIDAVTAGLRRYFGLNAEESPENLLNSACADASFDVAAGRRAAVALLSGSDAEQRRGQQMRDWLADPASRAAHFNLWSAAVLTQKGEVRKTACSKAVEGRFPGTLQWLQEESHRLLAFQERLKAAQLVVSSDALARLGQAILSTYQQTKDSRALLDYDDLVALTVALLERPGFSAWVLYKLDGGIDHLLIDEAQDTNPEQWRVVRALTEEFFAGEGANRTERTVFAVGDAKQSIYSFQRADPQGFEAMRRHLALTVPAAQKRWDEVSLDLSFRSAPAVLRAVDLVFNSPAGADGVVTTGQTLHHQAWRSGAGGLVELWPAIEPRPKDDPAPWKPPVERVRGDSPRSRLARLVAGRIQAMVAGKEILLSRGRPIRPGDILVLVRRRNEFVEDLVRELKALSIAVAGADRMVLTEQLAVMDLMALGNCLLLPEDDLTLATVLKGPLIGLTEEQLFTLAHGRQGRLWDALLQRSHEPVFGEALRLLRNWQDKAARLPPHDLFAHILVNGGRARLVARLGFEAEDPLDEFMALTLAYERLHPPSLQGFLGWVEQGAMEIKRDLDQAGQSMVRIMTVHGAKGLQAPIVFLPDSMQVPRKPKRLLTLGDDGLLVWAPRAQDQDALCLQASQAANIRRDQEYRRLLYVAMTRAEDRLYICGWASRQTVPEHCWYKLIEAALTGQAENLVDPWLQSRPEATAGTVLRLGNPQTAAAEASSDPLLETAVPTLPDWAKRKAPAEPTPPRPLSPSQSLAEEGTHSTAYGKDSLRQFRRGAAIHHLLQWIPDLNPERQAQAMADYLGRGTWGLSYAQQAEICGEVGAVLGHADFGALFGPGSRAEVPVVGQIGGLTICGRIDRLLVKDDEVLVVDYKTDRPAPRGLDGVPRGYLRQMAAYRALLACIYPGRTVRCALLWTDLPLMMPLENGLLDDLLNLDA
ncbi:MAG TPA: double-strand break repair helicase AddA, partial [Rhodospirillaceae bacterium]|nr:double-strand break repair helicase AddA [Rhodospirillaceae bacterium]